jgi:hypothetical protein
LVQRVLDVADVAFGLELAEAKILSGAFAQAVVDELDQRPPRDGHRVGVGLGTSDW